MLRLEVRRLRVTVIIGMIFSFVVVANVHSLAQTGVPPSTAGWIWACNPTYGWTNCSIFIPKIRALDEKAQVEVRWDKGLACAPDWSCGAWGDGLYYLARDEEGNILKKEFEINGTTYYVPYFHIKLSATCTYEECWVCYITQRTIYFRVRLLNANDKPTTPWTNWLHFTVSCSRQECPSTEYKDYWR